MGHDRLLAPRACSGYDARHGSTGFGSTGLRKPLFALAGATVLAFLAYFGTQGRLDRAKSDGSLQGDSSSEVDKGGEGGGEAPPSADELSYKAVFAVFLRTIDRVVDAGIALDSSLWLDPENFRRFMTIAYAEAGYEPPTNEAPAPPRPAKREWDPARRWCGPAAETGWATNVSECLNRACFDRLACLRDCRPPPPEDCWFSLATHSCDGLLGPGDLKCEHADRVFRSHMIAELVDYLSCDVEIKSCDTRCPDDGEPPEP